MTTSAIALAERPRATLVPDTTERSTLDLLDLATEINEAHETAESNIRRAVEQAIRAGELLARAKAGVPHGTWGSWLAENVRFSARTARSYMQLAALNPSNRQRVANLPLREAIKVLGGKTSLDVTTSSASPEWYSPPHVVDAACALLGEIDLDPCWHPESPVRAAQAFTKADDGLARPWSGRVWLNPPYGREIGPWIERLVGEHERGHVSEAVALVPARVDTEWFAKLDAYPRCFVRGRITFSNADNAAPFPSAIIYLGERVPTFAETFRKLGPIFVRLNDGAAP